MRLGVVIPVYNERDLLPRLLERLAAVPPPAGPDGARVERIVFLIDDGSTDGTAALVERAAEAPGVRCMHLGPNQGKGAALRAGFGAALAASCDAVIVQDADLEYDPADHGDALAPLLDGRADAVIGSRFIGQSHRVLYYWHYLANRIITTMSNMASNLNLTDIECGTKAFTRETLALLELQEDRFGIEPEIVARLARARLPTPEGGERPLRVYEVPVSYAGRTYAEGKKITWRDGFAALRCIVRYNILDRSPIRR